MRVSDLFRGERDNSTEEGLYPMTIVIDKRINLFRLVGKYRRWTIEM